MLLAAYKFWSVNVLIEAEAISNLSKLLSCVIVTIPGTVVPELVVCVMSLVVLSLLDVSLYNVVR